VTSALTIPVAADFVTPAGRSTKKLAGRVQP